MFLHQTNVPCPTNMLRCLVALRRLISARETSLFAALQSRLKFDDQGPESKPWPCHQQPQESQWLRVNMKLGRQSCTLPILSLFSIVSHLNWPAIAQFRRLSARRAHFCTFRLVIMNDYRALANWKGGVFLSAVFAYNAPETQVRPFIRLVCRPTSLNTLNKFTLSSNRESENIYSIWNTVQSIIPS